MIASRLVVSSSGVSPLRAGMSGSLSEWAPAISVRLVIRPGRRGMNTSTMPLAGASLVNCTTGISVTSAGAATRKSAEAKPRICAPDRLVSISMKFFTGVPVMARTG